MKNAGSAERRRSTETFGLFQETAMLLVASRDLTRVLEAIMQKVHDYFSPETSCLLLLDDSARELRCEVAVGSGSDTLKGTRTPLGDGAAGWCAQQGKPLLVSDKSKDARFRISETNRPRGDRSLLCVPISGPEKVLGVFKLVGNPGVRPFSEEDVSKLTVIAGYAAIALENGRYSQHLLSLTITDDCTGLYNARHFRSVLGTEVFRASRFGHEFSLVFIDLDHFKDVNDRHGHQIGSKLLRMVADLIKDKLRLIDSAFRYGGDEFVLFLPHTSKDNALVVVRRLREALNAQPFSTGGGPILTTTASFGVASFPADGSNAQELLEKADQAMYRAKSRGGNKIAVTGEEAMP